MERTLTIRNKKGLHARAAAKFAGVAGGFTARIEVSRGGQTVTATSIMGLMMLAAAPGCDILVTADGADAEAALDAVEALVENRFDESE